MDRHAIQHHKISQPHPFPLVDFSSMHNLIPVMHNHHIPFASIPLLQVECNIVCSRINKPISEGKSYDVFDVVHVLRGDAIAMLLDWLG